MTAPINENDSGQVLGAWLLELDGPQALEVSIGGPQRKLLLGLPQAPFLPESTRPTRAPGLFLEELRAAFGWELRLGPPPAGPLSFQMSLAPRPGVGLVRLRDPVLHHFRSLQAELAERRMPLELRFGLMWDCCSTDLADEARLAVRIAMRRRRPRREVFGLLSVWVEAVRLRASIDVHAPVDPGRIVEGRIVRALSRDMAAAFTTTDAPAPCRATPDVLFGLLSLCSLAEEPESRNARKRRARRRAARRASLPL